VSESPVQRRLLLNGEALRIDVTAPRSGGGTKFEPQTAVEARELLAPQLDALLSTTASLTPDLRADRQLYVEARLLPNYIAASDYPQPLLSQIGAVAVGSRSDRSVYRTKSKEREAATRRLILAVDEAGLAALADLMASGGRTRTAHQAFEEIRKLDSLSVAGPETVVRARPEAGAGIITWEAVLNPSAIRGGEPLPLDEDTMGRWFAMVERSGGQAYRDFVRTVGGLTFSPVALDAADADQVARFNPLRALRPMPSIRPRPRFGTRSVAKAQPPANTSPVRMAPLVAVFDGGFDEPSTVLFPRIVTDITSEPADPDDIDHGTGVTGAVLCGLAQPGSPVEQPSLPVDTFRVLPAPPLPGDLDGYWVLDQIKQTVIAGGYKIVNLSIGPRLAVEDTAEPNRWTSELDQLAWDNDVLFVVASGNDGEEDQATGLHRVQVPADMANGLAVGACDFPSPTAPWKRAPYSSMGPGRAGNRIAPLGVQFGGVDDHLFPIIRADGNFLEGTGTSFAAPVHTNALLDLATRLPRINPSVLRAFSVHFAERHPRHVQTQTEVGYGRLPLGFADYLDCGPDQTHVLYVDQITRGELLGYQVPIPAGFGEVQVRMSLAYASPVEPTQPTEYTRASLELAFRPHHRMYRIRPPKGATGQAVIVDHTSPEAQRLFAQGWEMGQEPVTAGLETAGRIPEYILRDGGKWETLRHARISLGAGATEAARLEISYVARRAGGLDNVATTVPFALLISVLDPAASGDLYDRTQMQFAALRPVALNRNQVRVRARSPAWG
jgi:hypothetical protein